MRWLTLGRFRCIQSCLPKDTINNCSSFILVLHNYCFIKFIYLNLSHPFFCLPKQTQTNKLNLFLAHIPSLSLSSLFFLPSMEKMMKQQSFPPTSAPTKLAMHKDSHVVTKFKPKIRIIHVFAPEIIKTDVANFRDLVQSLTGKPAEKNYGVRMKKMTKTSSSKPPGTKTQITKKMMDQAQHEDQFPSSLRNGEPIKEEIEELWRSSGEKISSFLDGFSDFDGFIEGLNDHSIHFQL